MTEISNRKLASIMNALHHAGVFLRDAGFPREAIDCFLALAVDDETFEAGDYAFQLGLCFDKLGDLVEAHRYFEIAVRENPALYEDNEIVRRVLSH
jgi:tetratricopeptide (TPR) repeat protein